MEHLDDLYDILGVPPDATAEELHHARNRMLRYWHPDRSLDPLAPERAKRINAAYDVLADPERRAVYDQHRAARLARLDPGLQPTPPPPAPAPSGPSGSSWTETPWGGPPGNVGPGPPPGATATGPGGAVWGGGAGGAAAVPAAPAYPQQPEPGTSIGQGWARPRSGPGEPGGDVLSWPSDRSELLDRARRALPFAAGALLLWLIAPLISMVAPTWVLTLWAFASLFGVGAAVRALLRRPLPFRRQGWERFGAAWLAGSGAFVLVWQLLVMPLGPHVPLGLVDVLLLAAFLAGVGGVYLAWRR